MGDGYDHVTRRLEQGVARVVVDERRPLEKSGPVQTEEYDDAPEYADVPSEQVVGVQTNAGKVPHPVEPEDDLEGRRRRQPRRGGRVGGRRRRVVPPPDPLVALVALARQVETEVARAILEVRQLP